MFSTRSGAKLRIPQLLQIFKGRAFSTPVFLFLVFLSLRFTTINAQTCLGYNASLISHETPETIQLFGASANNSYSCLGGNYIGSERVFKFTVIISSRVSARLEFPNPANTNADIFLLSNCSPLTCIASGDVQIAEQTLAPGTYFLVVDSKTTAQFSVRVILSMKDQEGYCLPGFQSTCSPAYFIDTVQFTSPGVLPVSRFGTGCNGNALNYSLLLTNGASFFRTGAKVKLDVRMFRAGSHHSTAWIDYNDDKVFDPQTELLYDSNGRGKGLTKQTINHSFTIPELVTYGPKRLRIRNASEINGDVSTVTACNELREGETEDYVINLEPQICTPKYTQVCPAGSSKRQTFSIKNLNNQNVPCNSNLFSYTNYPQSQFTTSISPGAPYTVNFSFNYAASAAVWIDYNNDGDFFDADELVAKINTAGLTGTASFKAPSTPTAGIRKMRVRTLDASRSWVVEDACGFLTGSGQTQDYTISIVNQAISINGAVLSGCRGQSVLPGGTAVGDFLISNRFIGQFSDANGSFTNPATITEIDLGTNLNTPFPLPSNLTPGAAYKFRITSTSPVRTSAPRNVTIPSNLCNSPGVTLGKIGGALSFTACKGQVLSIPFSTNDLSTLEWTVQISGANGAEPFTNLSTGVTSPLSATIPTTLPEGKGYRIRIRGFIGNNTFLTSTSPTLIDINTCLKLATTPTRLCKGVPTTLAVASTGIANGTAYRAELSGTAGGFLAANNTVVGTSTVNNSIVVTIPCSTAASPNYSIRLVPTSAGGEPGDPSGNINIPISCPLNNPSLPELLCRGRQFSSQLNAVGCFNADNNFFLDFYTQADSSNVLFSFQITPSGDFTVPAAAFPGSYLVRHRSTSPKITTAPVGPFIIMDCPVITLNSVCRGNGHLTAQFNATNASSFFPGNQFRVELSSQAAGSQTIELGRTSAGSPAVVAQEPTGYPQERRIRIVSTNPVISSNFVNIDGAPLCVAPSITIQSISTNPLAAGTAAPTPTATQCSGGKLRIDFTTTGIFGADQVIVPKIAIGNNFFLSLGAFPNQSPIVVNIPPGSTPGLIGNLQLTCNFPTTTLSSTNMAQVTIGNCPTITTGTIANTNLCANANISIPFSTTGSFQVGNVFSAELLSFDGLQLSAPIALTGSGTTSPLQVSLPAGFSGSGSFFVRVKSSNPELVATLSPTQLNRLVPVLTGFVSGGGAIGEVSKVSGQFLNTVSQAFLGTTSATFSSNVGGTQIDLTIPNAPSGNWTVRNGNCVSNPLAQNVFAAINFNLFDAETDQNLGVLKGGTSIDLTNLNRFNIRGNFNTPGFDKPGADDPGSVKIELNGPVSQTIIDNSSPFTLFGETIRDDGTVDFLGSTLPVGNYTIKATPYRSDDAQGPSGIVWTTAFLVAPPRVITTSSLEDKLCQGEAFEVGFSTQGLYLPETVFSVELSDANGLFASPTILGAGLASPISAVIPLNQASKNGYRVRVSSVNPATPAMLANSNGAIKIKATPQLSALSKTNLKAGDPVTITGSGFSNVTDVLFNGLVANNFNLSGNEQKIKTRLPSGAMSGLVTVVSGGCTSPDGLPYIVGNCNGRVAVSPETAPEVVASIAQYEIFPNPSDGKITLRKPAGENATVLLVNQMGQQWRADEVAENIAETELDLSQLPSGLYLVRIESASGYREFKLIRR